MTVKKTLADLIAAVETKTKTASSGNQTWKLFFNFWKAPVDSVTTVRFLPDADDENPFSFFVENYTHELTINGKRETFPCLKHLYHKQCPICDLSARFYDKKSPDFNEVTGKSFYRKKSHIAQVLVIETPLEIDAEPLNKLMEFGPQIMEQMQAGWKSGDLENIPHELKGGHNFRIRKTVNSGGQNSYITSNYSPKTSDVSDDIISAITLYDLKQYVQPEVDVSVLEAALLAYQTSGTTYSSPAKAAPTVSAPAADSTPQNDPYAGMTAVQKLQAKAAARAAMGD